MVTWLAGGRVRGTSTERTTSAGFNDGTPYTGVGGWKELARTTLGSAGDTIDVSSIPDKRYYKILTSNIASGTIDSRFRVGNSTVDTGSNYARRSSENGGAEVTGVGNDSLLIPYGENGNTHFFGVHYIANLSAKEKLILGHTVDKYATGAGNAPARFENTGKWANTSNVIDIIRNYNAQSGSFDTGSEVVVLGWDDSDTHTTNFWEELASVETGGSGNISSGTFTAKKYLWVQAYSKGESTGTAQLRFNSDSGSNYADRKTENGGADATRTSVAQFLNLESNGRTTPSFTNLFIINNSANEKLVIGHSINQDTAGAANAPNRMEWVGKWHNTSSQITDVTFNGTHSAGSIIKVWGSN